MDYFFSLVLPTLGRDFELEQFCQSLEGQTYKNFELIVIDQNDTDKAEKVVNNYQHKFKITFIRSAKKGLSLNRNIGLEYAHGYIIAFPDDDCEYKEHTLQTVNNFFSENNYDFFTCNYEDKSTKIKHAYITKGEIAYSNLYHYGISFTIFCKKSSIAHFKFDTRLGLGAQFPAGEETDMIAYLLTTGRRGFYDGTYTVYHRVGEVNHENIPRSYHYGLGYGALHKKLVTTYKLRYYVFHFIAALVKNMIAIIISPHRKWYAAALRGKLRGYVHYNPEKTR